MVMSLAVFSIGWCSPRSLITEPQCESARDDTVENADTIYNNYWHDTSSCAIQERTL